jgi:hypothetical protein
MPSDRPPVVTAAVATGARVRQASGSVVTIAAASLASGGPGSSLSQMSSAARTANTRASAASAVPGRSLAIASTVTAARRGGDGPWADLERLAVPLGADAKFALAADDTTADRT